MKSARPAAPPPAPPKAPVKAISLLIPGEQPVIRQLELRDGDVLCLPTDTRHECAEAFYEQLRQLHPGKRFLVVQGDVHSLDEAAMNAAGWYRQ